MVFVFFFKQKTAYEMRISDWSSDVCSSDLPVAGKVSKYPVGIQTGVFFDLRVDIGHRATEVEAIDRPPYDGQLTALDGGLRHVVECEHGAERRLIEEAPQLLVAVVIVEASTGEQHRAVEQLLLETRFEGNDRFLNDRTICTDSRRRNRWEAACLIALGHVRVK